MKIEVPSKLEVLDDGMGDGVICPLDGQEKTESDCLVCDHALICCLLTLIKTRQETNLCVKSLERVLKWGK